MKYDIPNILNIINYIRDKQKYEEIHYNNFKDQFQQFKTISDIQEEVIGDLNELVKSIQSESANFSTNSIKIMQNARALSEKLEKLLKYFLEISQYNQVINFVTENIESTNYTLEKLFDKFKANSESLYKMANSVKQLALNTIIKSFKGQEQQRTISIIADNVTSYSEEIINIINKFGVDFAQYSELSQKIKAENKKFGQLEESIHANIVKVNNDIDIFKDYHNRIRVITPKLKRSSGIIAYILSELNDIQDKLNKILKGINENSKLNSLRFDEFKAIFDELKISLDGLNEIVRLGTHFLDDPDYYEKNISVKDPITGFDPYRISSLRDIFIFKLLFRPLVNVQRNDVLPNIIQRHEYIHTKKIIMVYLRTDVLFANGNVLEAEDVKYSLENYLKNAGDSDFSNIEGYEKFMEGSSKVIDGIGFLGKFGLYIQLKKNDPDFIYKLGKNSIPVIWRDSYPGTYLENTCGQFCMKEGRMVPNQHYLSRNIFIEEILFGQESDYEIAFGEGKEKVNTGFYYFMLSGKLSVDQRRPIFNLLAGNFDTYSFCREGKRVIENAVAGSSGEMKLKVYKKEKFPQHIEEMLEANFRKAGIICEHTDRGDHDFEIGRFEFFKSKLLNLFEDLVERTDNLFKAKIKMLDENDVGIYEEMFLEDYYLLNIYSEEENYFKDPDIQFFPDKLFNLEYLANVKECAITGDDGRFSHFKGIFSSIYTKFSVTLENGVNQLNNLKMKFNEDYYSLIGEYDFFQGAMEKFSLLIKEFEGLKEIIVPMYQINVSTSDIDPRVFANLKLLLNSFYLNLQMYENFLNNFTQRLKKIFEFLNKINDLSYFSAMEAEKNPDIKEDILSIIKQIRSITKENSDSNLQIELLIKKSISEVETLGIYVSKALTDLSRIFELIDDIKDLGGEILNNNAFIKENFGETLENIKNMNTFSELSLSKINELLSIYKESEKYFKRVISYNKTIEVFIKELMLTKDRDILRRFACDMEFRDYKKHSRLRELTLVFNNRPITFDPHMVTDNTSMKFLNFLHSGLFKISNSLSILPHIIKEWEIKNYGYLIEITLRDDIFFNNGEEVTSEDVIFSFYKIFNVGNPSPNQYFFEFLEGAKEFEEGKRKFIDGLIYISKKKFAFKFSELYTPFYSNLGTITGSVLWKGNTVLEEIPVGIGPFVIDRMDPKEIVLKKSEHYFLNTDNFDRINILIENDEKKIQNDFLTGKTDIMIPNANLVSIVQDQKISYEGNIYSVSQLDVRYLGFNISSRPELQLSAVRKAICYAIDKSKVVKEAYGRMAIPADGVLPPGILKQQRKEAYHYDPEQAAALLRSAGLKNGIKMPFTLSFSSGDAERKKAELIKEYLTDVNIAVELNEVSWAELIKRCKEGTNQLFLLGWISDNGDPDNFFYPLFHSRNIGVSGNYFWYRDADIDKKLDIAMTMMNREKRLDLYAEIENKIIAEAPALFLNHSLQYTMTLKNLKGFRPHPLDVFNLEYWWKI